MTDVPEAPAQSGVPTCYRHPGRETHLRCARCDRHICPDCMVEAAVGFQCPECVRAGNRTVRSAQGPYGGAIATRPYVTYALIAINVVIYLWQLSDVFPDRQSMEYGLYPDAVAAGEWWRMGTSMFIHAGLPHLAVNMLSLYWIGGPLELLLGRYRFLVLYVLSGLGGSVLVYLTDSAAVGASGAILGVFGAYFAVALRQRLSLQPLIFMLAINVMINVFSGASGGNLSWQGHLGGFVTGAVLGFAFVYAPRDRRTVVQAGASVGVAVVLAALTLAQTAHLTSLGY
ncbi:rhomboid family intramembrane serine protease [Actinocorallia lasiicapitis]